MRDREFIFSAWINCGDWTTLIANILAWADAKTPRIICICNVHSVVTARTNTALREAINESDFATPDGMPLSWLISRRRKIQQARINGPDLTMRLCMDAAATEISVAFLGSTEATLDKLRSALVTRFPKLEIACTISPPFRALTPNEDAAMVKQLNDSGAGIVFVGLGCPKQEIWMRAHRGDVNAVMIGVGAAFDYMAGTVKRPPIWMQRAGLEWLGRFIAEPRRLWRRYLVTNTIFIVYIIRELLGLTSPPNKTHSTNSS